MKRIILNIAGRILTRKPLHYIGLSYAPTTQQDWVKIATIVGYLSIATYWVFLAIPYIKILIHKFIN